MLNVEDLENYSAIDFIRTTYGKTYAAQKGIDTNCLPDMLVSDKELCGKLEKLYAEDPQKGAEIYSLATKVQEGINRFGIRSEALEKKPSGIKSILKCAAATLFVELYIFSLWPALFLYGIPWLMHKKLSTDIMFFGTFMYAFNVLFLIPGFAVATFFITFFGTDSLCFGLAHVALIPLLCIFAWNYTKWILNLAKDIRWWMASGTPEGRELQEQHNELWRKLKNI
jgi:hypothetical protein